MFTFDDIKTILAADPMNLPDIHVHNVGWTSAPFVDSRRRIHMNTHQLDILRGNLPIQYVKRIGPTTDLHRIKLDRHHLEGGVNDAKILPRGKKVNQQAIRDLTGQGRE